MTFYPTMPSNVYLMFFFQVENETISQIKYLADILEQCDFAQFWNRVHQMPELCSRINGFHDSIRKFVCHVVGITFQTIDKNNLANLLGGIDGNYLWGSSIFKKIYIFKKINLF